MKRYATLILILVVCQKILAQNPVTAGLVQDLDASVGFTANSWPTPSTWIDQSGADVNMATDINYSTANPTATTVNGMPAVAFGGNCVMASPSYTILDSSATVFIVTSYGNYALSSNAPISIVDATTDLQNEFTIEANTIYHHSQPSNWVGKTHQCLTSLSSGQVVVEAGAWRPGTTVSDVDMFLDGAKSTDGLTTYGTAQPFTSTPRIIHLGSRIQSTLYHPFTGNIFRVLVYNVRLTDAEILQVSVYLKNLYAATTTACIGNTGISDISMSQTYLGVYPSPSNGLVTIGYTIDGDIDQASISIHDMLGRVVEKSTIVSTSGTQQIDVSKYPAGIYTLTLENNLHQISTARLVKQ